MLFCVLFFGSLCDCFFALRWAVFLQFLVSIVYFMFYVFACFIDMFVVLCAVCIKRFVFNARACVFVFFDFVLVLI